MIIYYSGTGNSQYVAEALADRMQDEVICSNSYIKEGKNGSFHSETPWIFVYPIYVSIMPQIFRAFLEKSNFSGCRSAYFVATCASAMGVSVNVGKELCQIKGLEFRGAEKVVMPQDYIALFSMTPPEEIKNRQTKALTTADQIAQSVQKNVCLDMNSQSSVEYAMTKGIEKLYNNCFTGTKKFRSTDACIGCGLCAKVCPLNNIKLVNQHPQWDKNCVHCMGCINRCPKQAIEFGKKTEGKARYVCVKYARADLLNKN